MTRIGTKRNETNLERSRRNIAREGRLLADQNHLVTLNIKVKRGEKTS